MEKTLRMSFFPFNCYLRFLFLFVRKLSMKMTKNHRNAKVFVRILRIKFYNNWLKINNGVNNKF